MYSVKYINKEILSYKPSEAGWLWPEHDIMFGWFSETIEYYSKVYERYCRAFNVAIQAGGHCGVYPSLMGKQFDTVYSFEPDTLSFHFLVNNCQSDNIKKFNAALGSSNTLMYQTFRGQHNVGVNTFKESDSICIMKIRDVEDKDIEVIPNTIQLSIDSLGLNHCDLIHLDTEGQEDHIIFGAKNTIFKFKPLILTESLGEDSINLLTSMGYTEKKSDMPIGDTIFCYEGTDYDL